MSGLGTTTAVGICLYCRRVLQRRGNGELADLNWIGCDARNTAVPGSQETHALMPVNWTNQDSVERYLDVEVMPPSEPPF